MERELDIHLNPYPRKKVHIYLLNLQNSLIQLIHPFLVHFSKRQRNIFQDVESNVNKTSVTVLVIDYYKNNLFSYSGLIQNIKHL